MVTGTAVKVAPEVGIVEIVLKVEHPATMRPATNRPAANTIAMVWVIPCVLACMPFSLQRYIRRSFL